MEEVKLVYDFKGSYKLYQGQRLIDTFDNNKFKEAVYCMDLLIFFNENFTNIKEVKNVKGRR